jgi:hypothetical protein
MEKQIADKLEHLRELDRKAAGLGSGNSPPFKGGVGGGMGVSDPIPTPALKGRE